MSTERKPTQNFGPLVKRFNLVILISKLVLATLSALSILAADGGERPSYSDDAETLVLLFLKGCTTSECIGNEAITRKYYLSPFYICLLAGLAKNLTSSTLADLMLQ